MANKKKIPQIVKQIKNTKLKDIDYKYQHGISYSQISIYNQCPYKWYLNYVKKIGKFEHSIYSTFGTSMHTSMQHYLSVMYEKSKAEADRIDIVEYFKENLKETYSTNYEQNEKKHFSDALEIAEFFSDGKEILEFFSKKTNKYFSKRGWYLVGVEVPLKLTINPKHPNIIYTGLVDLIMYHEPTDKFKLYDFKTSTYSWGDGKKKDENKQFQLILYKYLFCTLFGIDPKSVEVEFLILKRKLYENCDFPQGRIQVVSPPSGKIKIKKALNMVNKFIEECFTSDGKYKDKTYLKNINGCKWCTFNNTEYCDKKNKPL